MTDDERIGLKIALETAVPLYEVSAEQIVDVVNSFFENNSETDKSNG